MNPRIIYESDSGGVAVIVPVLDCGLTVQQIAEKDVPAGKAYQIIGAADLPDRAYRSAWVMDGIEVKVCLWKALRMTLRGKIGVADMLKLAAARFRLYRYQGAIS